MILKTQSMRNYNINHQSWKVRTKKKKFDELYAVLLYPNVCLEFVVSLYFLNSEVGEVSGCQGVTKLFRVCLQLCFSRSSWGYEIRINWDFDFKKSIPKRIWHAHDTYITKVTWSLKVRVCLDAMFPSGSSLSPALLTALTHLSLQTLRGPCRLANHGSIFWQKV